MSKNLSDQITRMQKLWGFTYKENSHDILSEEVIKKSLGEQMKGTHYGSTLKGPVGEEITVTSLKKVPATNATIKEAMELGVDYKGWSFKLEDVNRLWATFPNLGEALKKRAKIKTMYDYWDKAGNMSMDETKNKAVTIYSIGGSVILNSGKPGTKDVKFEVIPLNTFVSNYNTTQLGRWANKERIQQIQSTPKNNWKSNGIVIRTGMAYQEGFHKGSPKVVNTYQAKKGGKMKTFVTMVTLPSGKALTSVEGGQGVLDLLNKAYDNFGMDEWNTATTPVINGIPFMTMRYRTDLGSGNWNNSLYGLYTVGSETTVTQAGIEDETTTTKTPFTYPGKEWSETSGFDPGKFNVEDSPKAQAFIDKIVNDISDYAEGKENVQIGPIEIISSASNKYGGEVSSTHDNDGNPIAGVEDDFHAKPTGSDNSSKNKIIAYNRGRSLIKALNHSIEELKKKGNINFDDVTFSWRITDTGGEYDKDRKETHQKKGQYVFVKITGAGTGTDVDTEEIPGSKIKIGVQQTKSIYYNYEMSPGKLAKHPNAKFADVANFIQTLFGGGRTKQTPVNQVKKVVKELEKKIPNTKKKSGRKINRTKLNKWNDDRFKLGGQ